MMVDKNIASCLIFILDTPLFNLQLDSLNLDSSAIPTVCS